MKYTHTKPTESGNYIIENVAYYVFMIDSELYYRGAIDGKALRIADTREGTRFCKIPTPEPVNIINT